MHGAQWLPGSGQGAVACRDVDGFRTFVAFAGRLHVRVMARRSVQNPCPANALYGATHRHPAGFCKFVRPDVTARRLDKAAEPLRNR